MNILQEFGLPPISEGGEIRFTGELANVEDGTDNCFTAMGTTKSSGTDVRRTQFI